jgi:hypothetical protein
VGNCTWGVGGDDGIVDLGGGEWEWSGFFVGGVSSWGVRLVGFWVKVELGG